MAFFELAHAEGILGRNDDEGTGGPAVYRIRVRGALDASWSDWFEGMAVTPLPVDETLLAGPVADQAALHGLLGRIRDLNLGLLSVHRVEAEKRRDGFDGCTELL